MWNDFRAFTTFIPMKNSYVSLANNYKIPISGCGTIQLNINGYLLLIHDVYYIPQLQFCLYSVKQHRKYIKCSCVFNNNGSTLHFLKFKFTINDDYDMLIHACSISKRLIKIHWSSLDGVKSSIHHTSIANTSPISLPSHNPTQTNKHIAH